jgi:hypothetical protein
MPLFGGPIETLLVAGTLLLAVVSWPFRRREQRQYRYRGPRLHGDDVPETIDQAVLEEAEREVRDLRISHDADDGVEEDDRAPGQRAGRPRRGNRSAAEFGGLSWPWGSCYDPVPKRPGD